ncbi:MAG: hypothetical protein DI573_14065 [Microbacterium sp.]|nr:MAG: hypothetical protein DI573_14065 [Microbacterium sp.]
MLCADSILRTRDLLRNGDRWYEQCLLHSARWREILLESAATTLCGPAGRSRLGGWVWRTRFEQAEA